MFRLLSILFLLPLQLCSASFIEIKPVSNTIIALKFSNGYAVHAKLGQIPWSDGNIFVMPLDTGLAKKTATYTISSISDINYTVEKNPVQVGLKSKGVDFLDKATAEGKRNYKVLEHWIYLVLPKPMQCGDNYAIKFNGLADNQNEISFPFNEGIQQSETIHVNQVGFSTNAPVKFAYLYNWLGDLGGLVLPDYAEKKFFLFDVQKNIRVFSGKVELRRVFNDSRQTVSYAENDFCNSNVYQCDFSGFNIPGEYKIVVEGVGCSNPFSIGENGYYDAYYTTVRGLFHHRSGMDRTTEYTKWPKPIEHKPGVNGFEISYSNVKIMDGGNNFKGLEKHATGEIFPTKKGSWMPANDSDWGWGGYFDAGDFDRQAAHMTASEYLMYAYELAPENFQDNDLNIPESGNGIPDILDEAKWGIDCYRRLQGPTGGICGGMEENEHPLPGENSVTDSRPWFVYAEEANASFRLASAATQLAFCMEKAGNTSDSDSLIKQAIRVYNWAKISGDKDKCSEVWQRAAAWLYKYTKDDIYLSDFTKLYKSGVRDEFALFTFAYSLSHKPNSKIKKEIIRSFTKDANLLVNSGKNNPIRLINGAHSGWHTINYLSNVHKLIFAYHLTGNPDYKAYIYTTCDYNLGGNPENKVFVTGLGEKCVNEIMNTDSWFDGIPESIPGIVPYGFPKDFMQDDSTSVWRPYQTFSSCYPDYNKWPTGELIFENRYLINCNEYTITETLGPAAGAYAYLAGRKSNYNQCEIKKP